MSGIDGIGTIGLVRTIRIERPQFPGRHGIDQRMAILGDRGKDGDGDQDGDAHERWPEHASTIRIGALDRQSCPTEVSAEGLWLWLEL